MVKKQVADWWKTCMAHEMVDYDLRRSVNDDCSWLYVELCLRRIFSRGAGIHSLLLFFIMGSQNIQISPLDFLSGGDISESSL